MKILIIALARLGDNLLCWPAIRATKRCYPEAEIHIVARKRFAESFYGLHEVKTLHIFDTATIFEPQFLNSNNAIETINRCKNFIIDLKQENFTHIINMTFSPASAFLTRSLVTGSTEFLSGYSVHDDGCIFPVDDISAYYYAQGGINGNNRFHLSDIFATQCKVDLLPTDWCEVDLAKSESSSKIVDTDMLIHLTSSSLKKTLSINDWSLLIEHLFSLNNSLVVGFVGSSDDVPLIQDLIEFLTSKKVTSKENFKNLAGANLSLTLQNLKKTSLLIGADSAPIHLASHAKIKTYNISLYGKVQFWETGPRAIGSAVKILHSIDKEVIKQMSVEITELMLENQMTSVDAQAINACPSYEWYTHDIQKDESWNLVEAIYMNKNIGHWRDGVSLNAVERLDQANQLILNQLYLLLSKPDNDKMEMAMSIIEQCDHIIDTLAKSTDKLDILIRWYKTEKLRIPVCQFESGVDQLVKIHTVFKNLLTKIIESQKVLTVANSI